MNRLKIHNKAAFYSGLALITLGILLRWLIERILIPDGRIELPLYAGLIFAFQFLAIATGIFLLVRQPAITLPKKSDIGLLLFSTFLTFFLLEIMARLWLNYAATPDQYDRFVLFTNIDAQDYAWTPHPYLAYYPTSNYKKGLTSHNSLG